MCICHISRACYMRRPFRPPQFEDVAVRSALSCAPIRTPSASFVPLTLCSPISRETRAVVFCCDTSVADLMDPGAGRVARNCNQDGHALRVACILPAHIR